MKVWRDYTRGRSNEEPLAWLVLAAGAVNLLIVTSLLLERGGAWQVILVVLTTVFVVWAALRLRVVRSRERAARAAEPPLE